MHFRQRRDQDATTGPQGRTAGQQGRTTERTAPRLDSGAQQRVALRDLRQPRSARLVDAVSRLDTGLDEAECRQLAEWISREYGRLPAGTVPLGLVAVCLLGPPYVDHRLSLAETILEHYTPADRIPEPFGSARPLARNPAYAFVEVYADGLLVPVRPDGTPVVS